MKLFRIIVERDGNRTRSPGVTTTELVREEIRFVAEDIRIVLNKAEDWLNDPGCTVLAIVEDQPAVIVLSEAVNDSREAVSEIRTLQAIAQRYEKLRKLNPRQFAELYEEHLKSGERFDDMVDKL